METHLPVNCSSGHRKLGESEFISVWPRPLAFHEGQRETRSRFSQGHRVQLDKSFTHFVGGSGETWGNQESISVSHCFSISQVPFYPLQHMYLLFSIFLWNQETRFRTRALICCFSVLRDKVPNHQWKDDCLHSLHSSTSGDAAALSSSSVCSGKSMNNNID